MIRHQKLKYCQFPKDSDYHVSRFPYSLEESHVIIKHLSGSSILLSSLDPNFLQCSTI
jgi:hypothetical protein